MRRMYMHIVCSHHSSNQMAAEASSRKTGLDFVTSTLPAVLFAEPLTHSCWNVCTTCAYYVRNTVPYYTFYFHILADLRLPNVLL